MTLTQTHHFCVRKSLPAHKRKVGFILICHKTTQLLQNLNVLTEKIELCPPQSRFIWASFALYFLFLVTVKEVKACHIVCHVVQNLYLIFLSRYMLNCVLVLLFYSVVPISMENLTQKVYFELHASKFVICSHDKKYGSFLQMGFDCLKATEPHDEAVYFLPVSPQEFLVLIWSTLKRR